MSRTESKVDKPKAKPEAKAGKEKPPIDRCLEKIASFTDREEFQTYLDENWVKIEHAFKDAPACMKQATKAMTAKLAELAGEAANG